MKTLMEIKKENEIIVEFELTTSYSTYEYLCDSDLTNDPINDISACLEYTLHRMLESDFTQSDIYGNSAMEVPPCHELVAMEEIIYIDLGYIINGSITLARVLR